MYLLKKDKANLPHGVHQNEKSVKKRKRRTSARVDNFLKCDVLLIPPITTAQIKKKHYLLMYQ